MTAETLHQLTQRFLEYTDRYRLNGVLHPMHQLKLEHTVRVAADARAIAAAMHWPEEEIYLAEAIGLFHDIARFPQYQQYQSFSDHATVDHGDLGAQTVEDEGILSDIASEPRSVILHAVKHHNKKSRPSDASAHQDKHLRLIRDADRLDIFFVCWENIHSGQIHRHPEMVMNLDFYGPPSDTVIHQFERGEPLDYRCMTTMADRFILQLSWIHDLSFNETKRLVRNRCILEKFIDVLPVRTDPLLRCFQKTANFLARA
ncbi:MAG: HD domain-containing protein [Kiritimatiellaceae bacterium]|nr:HD domain-containing protein [Kiritimatiellaceae bacterium]